MLIVTVLQVMSVVLLDKSTQFSLKLQFHLEPAFVLNMPVVSMISKYLLFTKYCSLYFFRLADQIRMMNFPQWFDLLKDIFSKFTIFLKRIKVRH